MAEKRRILRRLHITNVDRTWKGRNGYSKAVLFKAVDADIDKAYHSARRSGAGRASGSADQRLEQMRETHSAAHIAAMRRYIEQGLSFEEAHERALAEIGKAMGLKVGDWVQYTVPKPPEPPTPPLASLGRGSTVPPHAPPKIPRAAKTESIHLVMLAPVSRQRAR